MAIGTPVLLDSDGSTAEQTTYSGTLDSTPTSGQLVLVCVSSYWATGSLYGYPSTLTVAGVSLSLVHHLKYKDQGEAGNCGGMAVYAGTGSWSGTGFSVTFSNAAISCGWLVYEISGAQTSLIQYKDDGGGVLMDEQTRTVVLDNGTPDSSGSRCFNFACVNSTQNPWCSHRANWSALHDEQVSTPSTGLQTAWRSDQFEDTASITIHIGNYYCGQLMVEIGASGVVEGSAAISAASKVEATASLLGENPFQVGQEGAFQEDTFQGLLSGAVYGMVSIQAKASAPADAMLQVLAASSIEAAASLGALAEVFAGIVEGTAALSAASGTAAQAALTVLADSLLSAKAGAAIQAAVVGVVESGEVDVSAAAGAMAEALCFVLGVGDVKAGVSVEAFSGGLETGQVSITAAAGLPRVRGLICRSPKWAKKRVRGVFIVLKEQSWEDI